MDGPRRSETTTTVIGWRYGETPALQKLHGLRRVNRHSELLGSATDLVRAFWSSYIEVGWGPEGRDARRRSAGRQRPLANDEPAAEAGRVSDDESRAECGRARFA